MSRFTADKITDAKRLVRGEHWLMARTLLRRRDEIHHASWRILTTAGESPDGEIKTIRSLMPKAYIVAADRDTRALEAAIDAGVDAITTPGDLLAFPSVKWSPNALPSCLGLQDKFDVVNLDLCGVVNGILATAVGKYLKRAISSDGILMVTFSYGRDVVEMFSGPREQWPWGESRMPADIPDRVANRIWYLGNIAHLRSVMIYRGNEMPMCALLYSKATDYRPVSFVKVGQGDFEIAVVYPESADLYDCPQQRIESLRRKFAAIKASITREQKQRQRTLLDDVEPAQMGGWS